MQPIITLVGRPNVGKSTLFNYLTKTRNALVADYPGLTRDRQYGAGRIEGRDFIVIDTGGFSDERVAIDQMMQQQTLIAVQEADVVVILVDGRAGLTAADASIARQLRIYGKPIHLAVNKIDGVDPDQACADFYSLGFGELCPIAAATGRGVKKLMAGMLAKLSTSETDGLHTFDNEQGIRIAFVGRPNVGKSTLINRLIGEERLLTYDQPGTTRDSVAVPFEEEGRAYTLIDTAGVRRRSRIQDTVEKFSVVKSLRAIDAAHVVIVVLDAREGISEQDASLLGLVLDAGRAVVVAINKWDGLTKEETLRVRRQLELRLPFLDFAERHMISALHGTGLGKLLRAVRRAYRSTMRRIPTAQLTRLLELAVHEHQPPMVRGRRIKLRYAHQGGVNPPRIVIHGNQTERVPGTYRRYLINFFRDALKLMGTPVQLEFKTGENPYVGRRNILSPRQKRSRKRLMKHVK